MSILFTFLYIRIIRNRKTFYQIMGLLACKKCRNVFVDTVDNVQSSPAKCPVCGETNSERI